MFPSYKKVSEVGSAVSSRCTSRNTFGRFSRTWSLLMIGLVALLIQSPIYATDPMDVDPDPDLTTTIIVQAAEEQDTAESLPPGHYRIIVVAKDGSTKTREIHKR